MFKPKMRDLVTERIEKIVMVVMMGAEEEVCFDDEMFVSGELLRSNLQCSFIITEEVEVMGNTGRGSDIDPAEVHDP